MSRQFLNSQEFPRTQPSPTMTLPRMKAPGRICVPAPIQAGPMRVAWEGKRDAGAEVDGALQVDARGDPRGFRVKRVRGERRPDLPKPLPRRGVRREERAERGEGLGEGEEVGCLQGGSIVHKKAAG